MNINCSKNLLTENINIVSKAVSNKSTMQILECILLSADENGFLMTSNDTEMGIKTEYLKAEVINKGSVALEAKFLSEIVRKMPDGDININVDSNNVTVFRNNMAELKILGYSGEDFPQMPDFVKTDGFMIPSSSFRDMIRQTSFSIAQDSGKPALTGGLIEIKDGYLNMVTVDGFRISYRRGNITGPPVNIKAIVPGRTLNEISKILTSEHDDLVIFFTDNHVLFEQKQFILLSRLIEGDFFRYEQSFSGNFAINVTADREELCLSIERSMLIARDLIKNPVDLKIEKNRMIISSNTETGTIYDEIEIELEGEGLNISFNPKYLSDVLRAIDDDKINLRFNTHLSPCVISDTENRSDYKYLVLPLRSFS